MGKPYFLCKKFAKKKLPSKIVFFFLEALLGFGGGCFFATWRGRALAESAVRRGGTALGVEVQLLLGLGGAFKNKL